MTSQLINLKSNHIPDEVKKVDDKVKKNITDIVTAKNSLLHSKSVLDDLEREASFSRGFYYYNQQSCFLFEPKSKSFTRNGGAIHAWISTEFIMTVIILTCFLEIILITIHQLY